MPYVLLSEPSLLPISVGILNFQGNYAATSTKVVAAGGILAMLRPYPTFVILQRFIVRALTLGAIRANLRAVSIRRRRRQTSTKNRGTVAS